MIETKEAAYIIEFIKKNELGHIEEESDHFRFKYKDNKIIFMYPLDGYIHCSVSLSKVSRGVKDIKRSTTIFKLFKLLSPTLTGKEGMITYNEKTDFLILSQNIIIDNMSNVEFDEEIFNFLTLLDGCNGILISNDGGDGDNKKSLDLLPNSQMILR